MQNRIGIGGAMIGAIVLAGWGMAPNAAVSEIRLEKQAPAPAAKGAVALFTGKSDDLQQHWRKRYVDQPAAWKIQDEAMLVQSGDIMSKAEFGDFHLHLEFKTPLMPNAKGQARGNSGIGIHGRYEVQVLDSYGIETPGKGDCGALYNQAAPLTNACKPPREWQTYDILFRAPRFDANGAVVENPRITVLLNGTLIQNNQEIKSGTGIQGMQFKGMAKTGPIILQDHGNAVEYRNIWVLPVPEKGSDKY